MDKEMLKRLIIQEIVMDEKEVLSQEDYVRLLFRISCQVFRGENVGNIDLLIRAVVFISALYVSNDNQSAASKLVGCQRATFRNVLQDAFGDAWPLSVHKLDFKSIGK